MVIKDSFTVLGSLVNDMMSKFTNLKGNEYELLDALYVLHLICKIFYVSN